MRDGSCGGCPSRRDFCAVAGASLLTVGLAGCSPAAPARLSEGAVGTVAVDSGSAGGGGAAGDGLADGGESGGGGAAGGGGASSCTPGTLAAGAASSYTVGAPKSFANAVSAGGEPYTIFVTKDAGGFYAMDADCTHAGCPVALQSTTYYCSCHGASFDANGQHTSGPGSGYLQHYAVCIDAGGNVTVDLRTAATPTQRF